MRLHWHRDPTTLLAGNVKAGYWYGDGCPPECPGLKDPRGWSGGAVEGREHWPPELPREIERRLDRWMSEPYRPH